MTNVVKLEAVAAPPRLPAILKGSSANQAHDFPAYDGDPIKYIVAAQARSGSHLLCQTLYRTCKAGVPLEYFNTRHWLEWCKRCNKKNPPVVLSTLMRRRTSPNGLFGVKMHWPHLTEFVRMGLESRMRDAKFVYLTRDDLLGQAISRTLAIQTGRWIGAAPKNAKPVPYSAKAIERSIEAILEQRRQWELFFTLSGVKPLRVSYEAMLEDRPRTIQQVFDFIGADVKWHPDMAVDPIPSQRTSLNDEWRERFLAGAAIRHDESRRWQIILKDHIQSAAATETP